jgi:hypothetical protein
MQGVAAYSMAAQVAKYLRVRSSIAPNMAVAVVSFVNGLLNLKCRTALTYVALGYVNPSHGPGLTAPQCLFKAPDGYSRDQLTALTEIMWSWL